MQDEPRRRNQSGSTGPVRLGDLIRDGKLLWAYCRACGHERDLVGIAEHANVGAYLLRQPIHMQSLIELALGADLPPKLSALVAKAA